MTVSAIILAAFTAIYGYVWSVEAEDPRLYLPLISVFVLIGATVLCVTFNRVEPTCLNMPCRNAKHV